MRTVLLYLPLNLLLWITTEALSEHLRTQHNDIRAFCQAQCMSFCYDLGPDCDFECQDSTNKSVIPDDVEWLVDCAPEGNPQDMDCVGTCSIIKFREKGYIPAKPEVFVIRAKSDSYHLEWNPDINVTPNTVYLISQQKTISGTERWDHIGIVRGGTFTLDPVTDICESPVFRVAAVNRYGSRWFSNQTIPVNLPGPPTNICLENMEFKDDRKMIEFTLAWHGPEGWRYEDIDFDHQIQTKAQCRPYMDKVYVLSDKMVTGGSQNNSDRTTYRMTWRVPESAIGCTIQFQISARSRCNKTWIGPPTSFSVEIKCSNLKRYKGLYCKPPVLLRPGPVEQIKLTLISLNNGTLGLVSWQPPEDLGTAGRVEHYHIFYGIVNLKSTELLKVFQGKPGHTVVDGETFAVDIFENVTTLKSFETIGVMVKAAGPGQAIKGPYGEIVCADNAKPAMQPRSGHVITKDDTIFVVAVAHAQDGQDDSGVGVQIFWRRPNEDMDFDIVTYGVELGALHPNDSTTDNSRGFETLSINMTTGNENFIIFRNLLPVTLYGIKIIPIRRNITSIEELYQEDWDNVTIHAFMSPAMDESISKSTVAIPINFVTHKKSNEKTSGTVAAIVLSIAVVLTLLGFIGKRLWARTHSKHINLLSADLKYRHYSSYRPGDHLEDPQPSPRVTDKWELPVTGVKLGPLLGSGAFGKVVKGRVSRALLEHRGLMFMLDDGELSLDQADKGHVTVAVKMLQDHCDSNLKQDFLKEIKLMKRIGHHRHVVSMLGCCTLKEPVFLVVEHQANGDLLDYLKAVRHQIAPTSPTNFPYVNENPELCTSKDLLNFAKQIALGMEFLSSKGYVHRDLAARNVLLDSNMQCKIGDFGLARFMYDDMVYITRKGGRLPVKWMSVEAIFDQSFSTASDVWSFGIVMFEIVTLGGTPYPTIPSHDLLKELQRGYRMDRPDNCNQEIYQMMLHCWMENPSRRPSFKTLADYLEGMLTDVSSLGYINMNINLDRDVYQMEDNLEVEIVKCSTQTANYDRGIWDDRATVTPEITSDDSGYTTSKKSSVSSGESGTATSSSIDQNMPQIGPGFNNDIGGASRLGGETDNGTGHDCELKPKDIRKRVSFCDQREMIGDDDVFFDEEEKKTVWPSGETPTECVQSMCHLPKDMKLRRCNSDPNIFVKKSEIEVYRETLCCHSQDGNKNWSLKRSNSEPYLTRNLCNGGEMLQDLRDSLKSEYDNKNCCKKRRYAVITPPTLALNNDIYFKMDGEPRFRQEPPATRVHRKHLFPTKNQFKPLEDETTIKRKHSHFRQSVVQVDVHQPPLTDPMGYTEMSAPIFQPIENDETGNASQNNISSSPSQLYPRQKKTYVKKDNTVSRLPNLNAWNGHENLLNVHKTPVLPSHMYTDIRDILHRPASRNNLNSYANSTTDTDNAPKQRCTNHKRRGYEDRDITPHYYYLDDQGYSLSIPVPYVDIHNPENIDDFLCPRVRNDSGLPRSPDETSMSSVEDSERRFFPQGRLLDLVIDDFHRIDKKRLLTSPEANNSPKVHGQLGNNSSLSHWNSPVYFKHKKEEEKVEHSVLVSEKHPRGLYRLGKMNNSH